MIKNYAKLVRDRIPEIIEKSGEKPHTLFLTKEGFIREIKKKILEEAEELVSAKLREQVIAEIIDIQELIDTLIDQMGIKKSTIQALQKIKNKERGEFKKRIFLVRTVK